MPNVGAIPCGCPENKPIDWAPTRGAPTGYEKKDELLSNSEKTVSSACSASSVIKESENSRFKVQRFNASTNKRINTSNTIVNTPFTPLLLHS